MSVYDMCIIGSGPAGLAALSSIQEDYSISMLTDNQINRAINWLQKTLQKTPSVSVSLIQTQFGWINGRGTFRY